MAQRIPLFYVAHSRTGDKGNTQTMSLIPYRAEDYELLARQVTPPIVAAHFGHLVHGAVTRFDLPRLHAFNFVLEEALQGGVNDSLAIDTHGKSRSSIFLSLMVEVPDDHPSLAQVQPR
ncbi:MAG TPA: hypothetical protein VGR65_08365 [Casimicrobiaceae bacterium]|jgi:hypothetical protein|nr:hypothetical protein [Casimicrobiaceae bacterium]